MAVVESTLANMVEANNAATAAVADKKQSNKDLQKTKLCIYFLEGRCGYGTSCTYAHSLTEVKSAPDLTKTQLCQNFANGRCNDKHCTYAHGEAELRDPPNFKKKLCKWHSKGKCRNGVNCGFAHDVKDLRLEAPPGFESLEVKVSQPVKLKKSQKVGPPPGLTKMDGDNDCDVSTDVPSSLSQDASDSGSSTPGAASIPEEPLFRFAAARGSAPLQQQVALMSSAIGGLQAKLGQLEDMMLQTQVLQMQQTIHDLSQQCWALEGQVVLEQPEPTPELSQRCSEVPEKTQLVLESGFEHRSRLNAKAAPFNPGM